MKKMRKISFLVAAVLTFSVFAGGCGKKEASNTDANAEYVNFADYENVDDIPDWTGEKVKLTVWGRANSPNDSNVGKISTDDVVTPEILRITGVEYDKDNSFDNGGSSFDARIAKMIAADEYPDMAYSIPDLTGLVDKGVLYRLDEIIEEYAPNIYRLFGPNSKVYGDSWKNQMEAFGGVYAISNSANRWAIRNIAEEDGSYELTPEQLNVMAGIGSHDYGYFYMRDDVLKALYPEAHTVAELEEIFAKNGSFTKEEIFDVPIDSPEDFVNMLYKVKNYINENNLKNTYATFTHNGSDNWPVLTNMGLVMGYNADYFSYWDKETKQIKYTYREDWFKDVLKTWNKLVTDDVASQEALIDTDATYKEKLNSGKYIVTLQDEPSEAALNGEYRYRPVYCRYTYDKDKFVSFASDDSTMMRISFFNKRLTKQQLIQAVRALDLLASDAGQKMTYWGPKKAGLYTEAEDGTLQFKDDALRKEMCGNLSGELKLKYNLDAAAWPSYPKVVASKYYPPAYYTKIEKYKSVYTPAIYEKAETVIGKSPAIYGNDFLSAVDGCKTFWAARNGFESALTKIFASANEQDFETNYKALIEYAERYDFNEETLKEANKFYEESYNADYMQNIK